MSYKDVKFRGKTPIGNWAYGYLVPAGDQCYIIPEYVKSGEDIHHEIQKVDPDTVGQSLQLYDSEGNLVYEGDVIQDENGCNLTVHGVLSVYAHWKYHRITYQTVVGNIHDNPELK